MIILNQYKKFDKLQDNWQDEEGLKYRLENFGVDEYKMFFNGVNDWEIEDAIENFRLLNIENGEIKL